MEYMRTGGFRTALRHSWSGTGRWNRAILLPNTLPRSLCSQQLELPESQNRDAYAVQTMVTAIFSPLMAGFRAQQVSCSCLRITDTT